MSTMKKVLALTLALVMALSFAAFGYTDSAEITATNAEAVKLLTAVNVIKGYTDDTFRPNGYITRAEAAKMIYVICNRGIDDKAAFYAGMESQFTDVPAGIWYEGYVNYCASIGVIAGRTATTFDPQANVTGYELAKMLLVVAEYKPEVQGYGAGATDWMNSVYNDAYQSYMLQDLNALLTQPINRQNAAKMMYNTLLNVNVATYIGDLLVTGALGGSRDNLTVGEKRMGLKVETGVVVDTNQYNLGGLYGLTDGAIVDNTIKVRIDGTNVPLTYTMGSDMLGHQVKVISRKALAGETGVDDNEGYGILYGIYPTGATKVYNTTINAITADNTNGLTVKFAGFNGDAAKAQTTQPVVFENDYMVETLNTAAAFVNYFSTNSAAPVKAVDTNGDGVIEYMFVNETHYGKVGVNNNRSRFSVTNIGNMADITISTAANYTAKLNLVGTIVAGDIVAITENYASGDLVYDIEAIAPTAVKAENWIYSGAQTIEKIKLDGTYYEKAENAIDGFALARADEAYYLANGYVVYSDEEPIKTAPTNVAMLLQVSENNHTEQDRWGKEGMITSVRYINEKGEEVVKNYVIPAKYLDSGSATDTDIIGYALYEAPSTSWTDTETNKILGTAGASYEDGLRYALNQLIDNNTIVTYVEDGENVYFRALEDSALPVNNIFVQNENGKFINTNDTLRINDYTLDTDENTFFFVKYLNADGETVYSVMKPTDFGATFTKATNDVLALSNYVVAYGFIDMNGTLPGITAAANQYAWLTGGYDVIAVSDENHTVELMAKDMTGEPVILTVIVDANAVEEQGMDNIDAWVEANATNKLVAYSVDADGYAALLSMKLNHGVTGGETARNITISALNTTEKTFRVGNGMVINYADETIVVTIEKDNKGNVLTTFGKGDDMMEAEQSYVLYVEDDNNILNAKLVVINLTGEHVVTNYVPNLDIVLAY